MTSSELETQVTSLRAQLATLIHIFQTTTEDGKPMLGGMERWQAFERECKLQEQKIARDGVFL